MEIKGTIHGERTIVSMGKVTATEAEVFTETPGQPRRMEQWIKVEGSWQLRDSHDLATTR